ncbi:MAG: SRPBCC family protein [Planctomycetes bacterium]|nr:SRPBCC family protein [Planctomycetota bacterium]
MGDDKKKGGFSIIKLLVYGVLLVAACVAGLFIYGKSIPEEHMATTSVEVERWPLACYEAVADAQGVPKWCSMVKEVKDLKKDGDKLTYTQIVDGNMELVTVQIQGFKPNSITIEVRESKDMFTGKWTFKFEEVTKGDKKFTKVTLTEIGQTPNAFWRAIGSFMQNPDDGIKRYLADLKKHVESQKPSS